MGRKKSLRLFLSILKENCSIDKDSDSPFVLMLKKKPKALIAIFGSWAVALLYGYYAGGEYGVILFEMLWLGCMIGILSVLYNLKRRKDRKRR